MDDKTAYFALAAAVAMLCQGYAHHASSTMAESAYPSSPLLTAAVAQPAGPADSGTAPNAPPHAAPASSPTARPTP